MKWLRPEEAAIKTLMRERQRADELKPLELLPWKPRGSTERPITGSLTGSWIRKEHEDLEERLKPGQSRDAFKARGSWETQCTRSFAL